MKNHTKPFVSILLIMLTSCSLFEPDKETDLYKTTWNLEYIEKNGEKTYPSKNKKFNLIFKNDGTFTGTNDCNSIGGNFTIGSNSSFKISKFYSTEVYCGDESLDVVFSAGLWQAESYKKNKEHLKIYFGPNGVLSFKSE